MLIAHEVKTLFVGWGDDGIVGIDKLDEIAVCHVDAPVARLTQSHIALSHIDDLVDAVGQKADGTHVRSVVDDDNLALAVAQR